MIIDATYFIGEVSIPNTGATAVSQQLNFFIEKYERELMGSILGKQLYDDLLAGLALTPTVDQKWLDLKKGVVYTDLNGRETYWKGLVTQSPSAKESLIAQYVYYWFVRNNATQTSGIGEVKAGSENAVNVSPAFKMVQAYNAMVCWSQELIRFLQVKKDVYDWPGEFKRYRPINVMNI